MTISPRIPRLASITAFALALLVVLSVLFTGPIIALLMALIPLSASIGISKGRVWSAYGFGVYLLGQLLLLPVILSRQHSAASIPALAGLAVFSLCLAILFLLAGRSLAESGAARGLAWPWMALAILTTVPLLFVEPFVVPTGAMEDTILIGDRIFAQRFPAPDPARGDLIVFVYPVNRTQTFVKRVIGVAGDRIRISEKIVYRNGTPLAEPYAIHKTEHIDPFRDNFPSKPNVPLYLPAQEMLLNNVVNGEVVVPPGKYFVMGDNRDFSLDSQYWGFVGTGDLIGKPLLIYDSEAQKSWQATNALALFGPSRTRWNRLFKSL